MQYTVIYEASSYAEIDNSQPSDNRGGGRFPQILSLFRVCKLEFSVAVWGRGNFEIIMINGMTLWSKLESAW